MKKLRLLGFGIALFGLITGCVTSQFQPITQSVSTNPSVNSVTIFLLERDLPPQFDRLGTVTVRTYSPGYSVHQQVEAELQKVGQLKGANGAYRIGHGTYDHAKGGMVTYLLFRYPTQPR